MIEYMGCFGNHSTCRDKADCVLLKECIGDDLETACNDMAEACREMREALEALVVNVSELRGHIAPIRPPIVLHMN